MVKRKRKINKKVPKYLGLYKKIKLKKFGKKKFKGKGFTKLAKSMGYKV